MAVMTFKSADFKALPEYLKMFANYQKVTRGRNEKTICEYLLDLRTFFRYTRMIDQDLELTREEFEKIDISDLSLTEINKVSYDTISNFLFYIATERANSNTTRNRKISSLRTFYNYMCDRKNLIDNNPTKNLDLLKKPHSIPKYLTIEESVRLLEAVNSDNLSKTKVRDYTIIALFLNTGMRLSELVGLNIQSIGDNLNHVNVLGKGNKERVIYLNDAAKNALATYLNERLDPRYVRTSDKALFLSTRQSRISPKTVQYIVYKYLDYAGLGSRGLSVHKLRHTAATLMYQSGNVDIRVLKDVLGHEQLNTTQIYTHIINSNLESAVYSNPLADVKIKKQD